MKPHFFNKILVFNAILALIISFSSCENVGVIDENEISPSLNDVFTILFNTNNDQNWTDTTINYKEYITDTFDIKTASICKLNNSENSGSGTILKIDAYNLKTDIKKGKEIIIFKNVRGISEIVIDGKFTRQYFGSDEDKQRFFFDGSIKLKSQKNETIYLHNLKHWTDGGITGLLEIKGKGRLLFERTGNTLFFDKRTIIY